MIGMFAINLCYNRAIQEVTLSLAAVLLSMSPIFVLILAAVFFGEKITKKKLKAIFDNGKLTQEEYDYILGA
jgi:drug/metabolite transporter (DMT)-like permease